MSKKSRRNEYDAGGERELALEAAIGAFCSNLYGELVNSPEETRFVRVVQRKEGDWMAVLAVTTEEGDDLVAFGNGSTFATALRSLSGSLAGNVWHDDKYSKRKGK